jgi:SAM-dependent methyltransferase
MSSAALWHEVECGGYAADLALWERLADQTAGRVLELGCGTGRVALHLARRRREVWGLDADAALLEALEARASRERVSIRLACGDVRALALDRDFGLIVAPMQLVQMLGGTAGRLAALEGVATHLAEGGRFAAAIVERPVASIDGTVGALPDVRERDGWVYSSLPTVASTGAGALEIRRLRQAVSPEGSLSEEWHVDLLDGLNADELEREASLAGLMGVERLEVPPTDGYLGSTVVVLGGG